MPGKSMLAMVAHPGWPGIEAVIARGVDRAVGRHVHDRLVVGVGLAGARVLESRNGPLVFGPGRVWVVPAGTPHGWAPCPGRKQDYLALAVQGDLLPSVSPWPAFTPPYPVEAPEVADLLVRLIRALSGTGEAGGLLGALIRRLDLRATAVAALHPATARVRARIDAAPDRAPGLAALARLTGVGVCHLERMFTRDVGVSLGEYVLARRVRLACGRLRAGDALSDAALAAGFCDQSHLTRHFTRRVGLSPGRCRIG